MGDKGKGKDGGKLKKKTKTKSAGLRPHEERQRVAGETKLGQ